MKRAGPDHRRLESRRVCFSLPDGSDVPRILQLAYAAEVRVWHFPDGWWLFASDSGHVNFMTTDVNTVTTKQLWPHLEKST